MVGFGKNKVGMIGSNSSWSNASPKIGKQSQGDNMTFEINFEQLLFDTVSNNQNFRAINMWPSSVLTTFTLNKGIIQWLKTTQVSSTNQNLNKY